MVGRGAETTLFSSGIAEFRSTARDDKLDIFSPEKRNLAKIRSEFRNLYKIVKLSEILDKKLAFQRKFWCRNFGFRLDGMTEIGQKIDGMAESGTP